jgi:hypothetical protein
MKKIINNFLEKFNQNIIRYDKLQALREALREIKSDAEAEFADLLDCTLVNPLESRAQLRQDLFVLHESGHWCPVVEKLNPYNLFINNNI